MPFKGLLLGAVVGLLASPVVVIVLLLVYTSIFGEFSGEGFESLGLVYMIGLVAVVTSVISFSLLGMLKYKEKSKE